MNLWRHDIKFSLISYVQRVRLNYPLFYAGTSWEVSMSLQVASFIFGALLLAVCILGGNFQFKDISVGQTTFGIRIVAGIAGLVFIVIGLVSGPPQPPS